MPSVIIETCTLINDIVRVFVVDEIFNLFAILFFVFAFIFIIYFGLDIEKGVTPVSASFSSMALKHEHCKS